MDRLPSPWVTTLLQDCSFRAEGARTAWIQRKSSELARWGKIPVSAGGNRKEGCGGYDLTLVDSARTRGPGRSGGDEAREGRAFGRCLRG